VRAFRSWSRIPAHRADCGPTARPSGSRRVVDLVHSHGLGARWPSSRRTRNRTAQEISADVITVDSWPIGQFDTARRDGTLVISPEYQRRPVWSARDQMLLIDSLARAVPIGAITLYADRSLGFAVYEVIDGKQRMTAIRDYLEDRLVVRTNVIASAATEEDEFDVEADPTTQAFHHKKFSELDTPAKMQLLQYKVPLFIVEGPREDAIRSFTRMNRNTYALKPQEIRNAFFSGTSFLAAAIEAITDLNSLYISEPPFFVALGVVSRQSYDRMQDVQLASELLVLFLHGAQHRRDTLDRYYSLYRGATGQSAAALERATRDVVATCGQVWELAGGASLQAFHFPSSAEHDFYGLVGALRERGLLSAPQMLELRAELLEVISEFRRQVELFIARVRIGESTDPEEFGGLVEEYGRGFLGGQVNSISRRQERIRIWRDIINGVVATLDANGTFSETQRRLIWARSADKACAKCGDSVAWPDYEAGHRVARALGGKTTVDNGQVEHRDCNRRTGVSGSGRVREVGAPIDEAAAE